MSIDEIEAKREFLFMKARYYCDLVNDWDDKFTDAERRLFKRKHYKCRKEARKLRWRLP